MLESDLFLDFLRTLIVDVISVKTPNCPASRSRIHLVLDLDRLPDFVGPGELSVLSRGGDDQSRFFNW